jgi:hypothetical protein
MSALPRSGTEPAARTNRPRAELDGLFDRLVAELRTAHCRMAGAAPGRDAPQPGG